MAGKKKWLGLAALAAVIVALVKREKHAPEGDESSGTMET